MILTSLYRQLAFTSLVVVFSLLFTGCPKDDPVGPGPIGGTIKTGTRTNDLALNVPSGGGVISITEGGIAGFQIAVPAGAYNEARTFVVSAANVESHTFGADFNVLSPLIRIENGGGYSAQPMTVSVPIDLPPDHFAMGFFYDQETGELEGIPVVGLSDTTITLMTAHFHGRRLSDGTKGGIMGSKSYVDLIITSIAKGELNKVADAGFRPGVDDWEFPNYGSFIAPKGHCAGQSMANMWYYSVQKRRQNAAKLYERFDLIPGAFWQDNPRGYRFSSVIQVTLDWDSREKWLTKFEETGTKKFTKDSLHYLSFVYGIRMTNNPQYIGIRSASGGGHAMIAYKAGEGKIWVCDPNYPGNTTREILLGAGGVFQPYMSGDNARSLGRAYIHIRYMAKSSLISHEGIQDLWDKFKDGTIGSGSFPAWELWMRMNEEGDFARVTSFDTIMVSGKGIVEMQVRCPTCRYYYGQVERKLDAELITPNYTSFSRAHNGDFKFTIKEGEHRMLGLYIMAQADADKDSTYMDFKWISFIRSGIAITPHDTTVDIGTTLTMVARTNGTAPPKARYEWYFDDLDDPVIVNSDSTITHTFNQAGRIWVAVRLINAQTSKPVDSTFTYVNVQKQWKRMWVSIEDRSIPASEYNKGPIVFDDGIRANYLSFMNSISGLSSSPPCEPLRWSGQSFSANISCTDKVGSAYTLLFTGSVQGSVSADGKTLSSVTWSIDKQIEFADGERQPVSTQTITLRNVPMDYVYDALSGPGNVIKGSTASQYVSNLSWNIYSGATTYRSIERVEWGSGNTSLRFLFFD